MVENCSKQKEKGFLGGLELIALLKIERPLCKIQLKQEFNKSDERLAVFAVSKTTVLLRMDQVKSKKPY